MSDWESFDDYAKKISPIHIKKRFELALRQRNFEIEYYWKRASYFWAIVAIIFGGKVTLGPRDASIDFLLACLGGVFTFVWYWTNRGAAYWHQTWDQQVKILGEYAVGPMFDPRLEGVQKFLGPHRVSTTKANEVLSLYALGIWGFLICRSLSTAVGHYEWWYPLVNVVVVAIGSAFAIFTFCRTCVFGEEADKKRQNHLKVFVRK